jgi:hypothetical protein
MHIFIWSIFIAAFTLAPQPALAATEYLPGSGWQTLTWTSPTGHTEFNNEGAFTFSVPAGQTFFLMVTEAGWNGARIEVYNQSVSTGVLTPSVDFRCFTWTDDFEQAKSSDTWSTRILELAPGDYELTFRLAQWCATADLSPSTWIAAFKVWANTAPTVSAGSPQTRTLPSAASLDGTVMDDGFPFNSLESQWSKVSGPGTVTFFDEFAIDTTARFSTPGEYVLRLTATDGELISSAELTITVNPVPPHVDAEHFFEYELWIQPQTSMDAGPVAIEGRIVNTGTLALKLPPIEASSSLSGLFGDGFFDELFLYGLGQLEPGDALSFNWMTGTIPEGWSPEPDEVFPSYFTVTPADSALRWNSGHFPLHLLEQLFMQHQWVTGPADTSLPFNKKLYNVETYGQFISFPPQPEIDFNDDENADLLWRNSQTGTVALWLMNWHSIVSTGLLGNVPAEWEVKGIGDVNNDGKADVVWQHSNGNVAVWLMNGQTISSVTFPGGVAPQWRIEKIGDVNGDGKADLVWRNTTSGQVAVWLMNGGTIAKSVFLAGVPLDWKIDGLGDLNGDDQADIVWRNEVSGVVAVWLMNGLGMSSIEFPGVNSLDWKIQGVGDFNGDGKADLLWQNEITHSVAIWLMNGGTILSTGNLGYVPPEWKIKRVADADLGPEADVVWQHDNGAVAVWLMNMNGTAISSVAFPGGVSPEWKIQP